MNEGYRYNKTVAYGNWPGYTTNRKWNKVKAHSWFARRNWSFLF